MIARLLARVACASVAVTFALLTVHPVTWTLVTFSASLFVLVFTASYAAAEDE